MLFKAAKWVAIVTGCLFLGLATTIGAVAISLKALQWVISLGL